jgi:hypothetical protein
MSFSQRRKDNIEIITSNSSDILQDFEKSFLLSDSVSVVDIEQFVVEYFYSDLIDSKINYLFSNSMVKREYIQARNEALECLGMSMRCIDVNYKKIPDWTEHSLKCFDCLLIKYISDGLKETINNNKNKDYETDVYCHFEQKLDNKHRNVGTNFKSIYQIRNRLRHVQYTDDNGLRRIKELRSKDLIKYKELVLSFYKDALINFFDLYKQVFPQ